MEKRRRMERKEKIDVYSRERKRQESGGQGGGSPARTAPT